jgi:hypothetical protein
MTVFDLFMTSSLRPSAHKRSSLTAQPSPTPSFYILENGYDKEKKKPLTFALHLQSVLSCPQAQGFSKRGRYFYSVT